MATANKNSIVKRIDVARKLTFNEMDTNFEQLKLSIDDISNVESQLSNKVETSVYDAKISEIDSSITALETGAVSEGRVDSIDGRVTVNENDIATLQPTVADNVTNISALDDRVTFNEGEIDTIQTNVSTNATDISALDGRVTVNENDIDVLQTPPWTSVNSSQTLSANGRYSVDFSGGPLTLTLPSSPNTNEYIKINKNNGDSEDSIIARNGNTIMGLAENLTIDYDALSINLVYNGTDWRIV